MEILSSSGDFIVCLNFVGLVFLDLVSSSGILGSHILESSSEFLRPG